MFATRVSPVKIPASAGVWFFIQRATSLCQGVPKLSDICISLIGSALLKNKFVVRIISGTITTYINLFARHRLTKSKTRKEQPRTTAGGTRTIMNLSPFDGNNWKNKNIVTRVNTSRIICSRYFADFLP